MNYPARTPHYQGRPPEEITMELKSFVVEARPGDRLPWQKLDNLGVHSGGLIETLFEQPPRFANLLNRGENRFSYSNITNLSLFWFHRKCGTCALFGDTLGQKRWVERMDYFFAFMNKALPDGKAENDAFRRKEWFADYGDVHLLLDVYRVLRQSWNTTNMLSSDEMLFVDRKDKPCSPAVVGVDSELSVDLLDRLTVLCAIASATVSAGMPVFFRTRQTGSGLRVATQTLHQWFQPIRVPSSLTPDMADVLWKTQDLVNWNGGLSSDLIGMLASSGVAARGLSQPQSNMWASTDDESSKKHIFTCWKIALDKHMLERVSKMPMAQSDAENATREETAVTDGEPRRIERGAFPTPGGGRSRKL